ncbi:hypothetical protein [Bradyrhizobium sp. 17-4]
MLEYYFGSSLRHLSKVALALDYAPAGISKIDVGLTTAIMIALRCLKRHRV